MLHNEEEVGEEYRERRRMDATVTEVAEWRGKKGQEMKRLDAEE